MDTENWIRILMLFFGFNIVQLIVVGVFYCVLLGGH